MLIMQRGVRVLLALPPLILLRNLSEGRDCSP